MRRLLVILIPAALLTGCAVPVKRQSPDRAFIQYWPPAEGSTGLRLAVKDLIDMKGVVTSAGSEYLARHSPPAQRDARCLDGARRRGVQIVGKTNLTEMAVAVSGINEYFGTPHNPRSRLFDRIPGGSSSGSAVAVANGRADVALGTDTAGSIRIPAACCGIVGLKTTFGLVPLDGVYPIAPNHLDTVGPMARDVAGTVQGMDLLQPGFAAQYRRAVASRPAAQKIRVGRLQLKGTNASVDRAIDAALAATGFDVVKLGRAFTETWEQAQKDGTTVAAVGAWLSNMHLRKQPGVTLRTKAIVLVGETQYRTAYRDALARQAAWKAAIGAVLRDVEFIALPTMQTRTPGLPLFGGTVAFEGWVLARQNTVAVNFAGLPALAVPVPLSPRADRLTSLQLIGPPRSEAALLNAGRLVEAAHQPAAR